MAGFMEDRDSKTRLNGFLQKFTNRMITKSDVAYKSGKLEGTTEYQATVTLHCLDDSPEFAGELASTKKEAEQLAASQALSAYSEELEKLAVDPKAFKGQGVKRKRTDDFMPPPSVQKIAKVHAAATVSSWKGLLFEMAAAVLKKGVTKEDLVFSTDGAEKEAGKPVKEYTTTLTTPCMPGTWGAETWVGEPCKSIKEAEHSAAEKAFKAMQDDPEVAPHVGKIVMKASVMEAGAGGGGDDSEGGAEDWSDWSQVVQWFQQMKGSMKGKGKGAGKPKEKYDEARTPVETAVTTGKIDVLKYGFGFIKPDSPIEHEHASKRNGLIWFSNKDLVGGGTPRPDWLKRGADVTFKVYADGAGLGAEDVSG
eukprot:TRINITY_DN1526_c0_g1_i1.p1 TRINITY_DN1526_c0_g1~~TRINITY_DN1526_c0_g1_i1.p1  ORF type:complete len:398 (-),score=126.60 TRINITY_DN1526_c0_g1_i1:112-1209(-)